MNANGPATHRELGKTSIAFAVPVQALRLPIPLPTSFDFSHVILFRDLETTGGQNHGSYGDSRGSGPMPLAAGTAGHHRRKNQSLRADLLESLIEIVTQREELIPCQISRPLTT